MNLPDYITKVGISEFAAQFGVSYSAAAMYRQGNRRPKPSIAKKIVARTPVTWEAIYGDKSKA